MGNDFSGKDGFSMYHGEKVPGFQFILTVVLRLLPLSWKELLTTLIPRERRTLWKRRRSVADYRSRLPACGDVPADSSGSGKIPWSYFRSG